LISSVVVVAFSQKDRNLLDFFFNFFRFIYVPNDKFNSNLLASKHIVYKKYITIGRVADIYAKSLKMFVTVNNQLTTTHKGG